MRNLMENLLYVFNNNARFNFYYKIGNSIGDNDEYTNLDSEEVQVSYVNISKEICKAMDYSDFKNAEISIELILLDGQTVKIFERKISIE